jgi:hypothetical protein
MAVVDCINAVWAIDGDIGVFSSALLRLLRAISGSGYSRMVLVITQGQPECDGCSLMQFFFTQGRLFA